MHHSLEPPQAALTRSEFSDALFAASLFAASVGAVWDLATGHVAIFDRVLSAFVDADG